MSTPNIGDDDFMIGERPDVRGIAAGGCVPGGGVLGQPQVSGVIGPRCHKCGVTSVANPGDVCMGCSTKYHRSVPEPPKMVGDTLGDPIIWVERIGTNTFTYEFQNVPNDQAARIIQDVLPGVLELYMSKSRDYGGNVGEMIGLGAKATFVDIWRKVGKLKRAMWDGQKMVGEQVDEILADLVGHVLIILDGMKRGD